METRFGTRLHLVWRILWLNTGLNDTFHNRKRKESVPEKPSQICVGLEIRTMVSGSAIEGSASKIWVWTNKVDLKNLRIPRIQRNRMWALMVFSAMLQCCFRNGMTSMVKVQTGELRVAEHIRNVFVIGWVCCILLRVFEWCGEECLCDIKSTAFCHGDDDPDFISKELEFWSVKGLSLVTCKRMTRRFVRRQAARRRRKTPHLLYLN